MIIEEAGTGKKDTIETIKAQDGTSIEETGLGMTIRTTRTIEAKEKDTKARTGLVMIATLTLGPSLTLNPVPNTGTSMTRTKTDTSGQEAERGTTNMADATEAYRVVQAVAKDVHTETGLIATADVATHGMTMIVATSRVASHVAKIPLHLATARVPGTPDDKSP